MRGAAARARPGWILRARNQVSAGLAQRRRAHGSLLAGRVMMDVLARHRGARQLRPGASCRERCVRVSFKARRPQVSLDSWFPIFSPPPRLQLWWKAPCRLLGAWHICARGWGLADLGCRSVAASFGRAEFADWSRLSGTFFQDGLENSVAQPGKRGGRGCERLYVVMCSHT